jgi:hypothetical protein
LARIVDRQRMGNYGHMQWSNSVTNRAEAQRLFARWAKLLREGLDEIHEQKFQADQSER